MEFPHHHNHHHQSRNNDGDEENHQSFRQQPHNNFADGPAPPPGLYQQERSFDPYAPVRHRSDEPYLEAPAPPPPFGQVTHVGHHTSNEPYLEAPAPPPPFGQVSHVGHVSHHTSNEPYPPENHHYGGYPPPPSNSTLQSHIGVVHVSHDDHSIQSNMSSGFHHRPDEEKSRVPDNLAGLAGRSTVKVYSKAEPNYYLTIRDGKVILAPSDPSDEAQHWYKDEKYSTRVKDEEGFPCFALVNKSTGEAVKHSVGATQPVHLTRYDPDKLDESVLWTESKDMGGGYRTIRMVNNVRLNFDAYHGDQKSGGVRDGTTIVLWNWNKGDNQLWKIFPF